MTVSTTATYGEFVADGLGTERTIGFQLRRAADLVVEANGVVQVQGTHYSVSGSYPSQKIVPMAPYWTNGTEIAYYRSTERKQDYDILSGVDLRAESLEDELDRLGMQQQEQDDDISRAPKVGRGQTPFSIDPTGLGDGDLFEYRDGKLQRFDSAPFAGKFYAGKAGTGQPVPASGSGADEALRSDLAADEGTDLIGATGGRNLTQELAQIAGDVSTIATISRNYAGVAMLAIVAALSTANIANPATADVAGGSDLGTAIGTTTDNQRWRLRNNTTGILAAANQATLWSFAVTRKMPVTAGTQYTFSLHNCPLGWYIYSVNLGRIQFFNSDGSFHSEITSGFTYDSAGAARQVTFTVPAGAEMVAFNLRNTTDFNADFAITSEAMAVVQANLMLNEGATALAFTPYNAASYTPSDDLFTQSRARDFRVCQQGEYVFIESACQQHATKNVIWRVLHDHGVNYGRVNSRSGVVDFYGIRFTPKSDAAVPSLFNQSTDIHCNGVDESCPERRNGMFVDGGHGSTCYFVTAAAHGKTNVDVGSLWTDGTSQWMLLYIDDANTLVFQRWYTGTITKWSISSAAPASSSFVHVSDATNTATVNFTGPVQTQFVPIVRDYYSRLMVGDTIETAEEVTADGTYDADVVWIEELYSGLNLARVQVYLNDNAGTPTPNWTPDVPQVIVAYRYEWNKWGALTIYCGRRVVEEYTRALLVDYWGAIQPQRLALPGDSYGGMQSKSKMYISGVTSTAAAGGGNFQAIFDLTSNSSSIDILTSDCVDPSNPASRFCLIGTNGADAIVSGQAFGYDRGTGLGVPATRAASVHRVMNISTAEKNYPIAIDSEAGDAVAGEELEIIAYRAPFLPTDSDLTIPAVIVSFNGVDYCWIAAHKTLTNKKVTVPAELAGKAITVQDSNGMAVNDNYVRGQQIDVSVAGSHGDAWLKIG